MNDLKQILWYIIPGTLVLAPFLLFINSFRTVLSTVNFIVFALLIGFVMQIVFRTIYTGRLMYNQNFIVYFKNNLNELLKEKNSKKRLNNRETYSIYRNLIFGNKNYERFSNHIEELSFFQSALMTLIVASLFVVVILSSFLLLNKITILHTVIGLIILGILIIVSFQNYLQLFRLRNKHIIWFLKHEFAQSEFKKRLRKWLNS